MDSYQRYRDVLKTTSFNYKVVFKTSLQRYVRHGSHPAIRAWGNRLQVIRHFRVILIVINLFKKVCRIFTLQTITSVHQLTMNVKCQIRTKICSKPEPKNQIICVQILVRNQGSSDIYKGMPRIANRVNVT